MNSPEDKTFEEIYDNFEMDLDEYFENKVDLSLEDKAEKWMYLQEADYEQMVTRRKRGF